MISHEQMNACLTDLLGGEQAQLSHSITQLSVARELKSGEKLFDQGAHGDSMYLVMHGRLVASLKNGNNPPKIVMEVGRHEVIGEIALFTDQMRTATVFASRDSLVLEISRDNFEQLSKASPEFALHISKRVIDRLSRSMMGLPSPKPKASILVVVATHTAIRHELFNEKLAGELTRFGPVIAINSADFNEFTADHAASIDSQENSARDFAHWIDEQETKHRFIILQVGSVNSEWAKKCVGLGDRILLLADHNTSTSDSTQFASSVANAHVESELVILHEPNTQPKIEARTLLQERCVNTHHNIILEKSSDIARLARFYADQSVGLVLAGGGAKGFAHVGAFKALLEAGIPIDSVGGTSIGSVVAALIAMNIDVDNIIEVMQAGFVQTNPLSDYTLPYISLIRGIKLNQLLQRYCGETQRIEDLWLKYYAVSANLTDNSTVVHSNGVLWQAIRASISLPGILPPVVRDNQLLVDGGLVNNLPVDIMAATNVGKIIAVDLQGGAQQFLAGDANTSSSQTLKKRRWFFGGKPRAEHKDPRLFEIMMRASLISSAQQTNKNIANADIFLNPPMDKIGLLEFNAFEQIVEAGYAHTQQVLAEMDGVF